MDDCLGQDKSTECDDLSFVQKAIGLDYVVYVAEACLVWQFPFFFYLPQVFTKINKNYLKSKKCKKCRYIRKTIINVARVIYSSHSLE